LKLLYNREIGLGNKIKYIIFNFSLTNKYINLYKLDYNELYKISNNILLYKIYIINDELSYDCYNNLDINYDNYHGQHLELLPQIDEYVLLESELCGNDIFTKDISVICNSAYYRYLLTNLEKNTIYFIDNKKVLEKIIEVYNKKIKLI